MERSTDGSEPDRTSNLVHGTFDLAETAFLRARAFRPGFYPSYTTPLRLRKLNLQPALQLVDAPAGLRYETRELWLCKKTADMDRYPVVDSGIVEDFSDDGSVLFIDGELIVDNDGSHRARERSGPVGLKAGFHAIRVRHFQIGGKPRLLVKWQGPGIKKEDIPADVLFSPQRRRR